MSSIKRSRRAARAGGTLVEYLVGIGIGGLVLTVVTALALYSGRSFAGLANYGDLNATSIYALDQLTKDIRQASGLVSFSTNELTFSDGTNNPPLIYTYSPASRTLVRKQGTQSKVLLRECDSLRFSLFQRTPIAGTFNQFAADGVTNCKVVAVEWVCSRRLLGAKVNSEEAQTARVVIRKH